MAKHDDIDAVWVTRAEYEAKFGRKPHKDAVAVIIYASDGTPICKCLFATPEDEVATLEALYEL